MQRVIVVGGGIIGLSCAWHLAQAGCRVEVLDGAAEAREASWAAAGMLAPHHEAEAESLLWRLCAAGLDAWPGFLAQLGADAAAVDWRAGGGWIRARDAAELDRLEAQLRWLRHTGTAVDRLSPAAFASACPGVEPGAGGLWLPGAQVDPRRVIAVLAAACVDAGVILRYRETVSALASGHVTTSAGRLTAADEVVLASGAWSPALSALAGIDLPGFIRSGAWYLLSRGEGRGVVVGATMSESGFDRQEDPGAIAGLATWAGEVVPLLRGAAIAETWTGLRPRLANGLPRIGRISPGLCIATGHFRNGILLAPLSGAMIAATITGKQESPLPFDLFPPVG
jgi:glycine oxidase